MVGIKWGNKMEMLMCKHFGCVYKPGVKQREVTKDDIHNCFVDCPMRLITGDIITPIKNSIG